MKLWLLGIVIQAFIERSFDWCTVHHRFSLQSKDYESLVPCLSLPIFDVRRGFFRTVGDCPIRRKAKSVIFLEG